MSDKERIVGLRSNERPHRFIEVGKFFTSAKKRYRCVKRPEGLSPSEACIGCSFMRTYRTCPPYSCSCFDRLDKQSVWFEEV